MSKALLIVAFALTGLLVQIDLGWACNDATQEQLFPLGTIDGDLVALEVFQSRGGFEKTQWTVEASLVRIAPGLKTEKLAKYKTRTYAQHGKHVKALDALLRRALRQAKSRKGFQLVRMETRFHCEHKRECGGASLSSKDKRLLIQVSGGGSAILSLEQFGLYDFPLHYEIAVMRSYRAATGHWNIVDLRAGNPRCDSLVDEDAARECATAKSEKQKRLAIADSYRWQRVYHHGFDKAVALWHPSK